MNVMDTNLKEQLQAAMESQLAGRFQAAEKVYREILKTHPEQPDAIHLLGLIRMEQERDEEAVALMEKALALFPRAAHFHHNIAGLYRRMGRLDEAEAEFREAIRLKPDYGEAFQGLAEMVKFKPGDPLIELINTQLARKNLGRNLQPYFHFAAGKILDDIGEYRQAFQHYRDGNRLTNRKFDSVRFRTLVKELLYVYGPSRAIRPFEGVETDKPVFILGMPRSGTTLVEQILASHSGVWGAGELNDMKLVAAKAAQVSRFRQEYPACIPGLGQQECRGLARLYLDRIGRFTDNPEIVRIIDKHPLNFQFIGLIFALFSGARVIHTVRNPLDTCLSCFFQNFTKGQDYSFDLKALAHFYNDYRRLMEHWVSIYPDRILTVRYEDVLEDQEAQTRRMLDFLGLDFEEACIDFHKTERKVSTASFLQVRQPLYKTSRQRWMNYRSELKELAEIIGVSIEEPITISGGVRKLT
ncbi:MAG: sulfotransferase [Proteobacteria bacterium]|nr:sulfotransferase [Pseudomonadota bacterium]